MTKYKSGTLVQSKTYLGDRELLMIILEEGNCGWDGMSYRVYNLTHNLFMERTEKFLDEFYEVVVE